jgi:hypothetical protein
MKGHSYHIPEGQPLAALVRQMWREQYQAMLLAIKMYGREGVRLVDLSRWQKALIDRALPLFRKYLIEGQENFSLHVENRTKAFSPVPLSPAKRTNEPSQVNQYLDVVDPNTIEIARNWTYEFAQSTLETTREKVEEAYKQTAYVMSEGLKENLPLEQLTQLVGMIFNDEKRAKRIAATEAARMFHAGQLKTAKQSGKVGMKTWRANKDACDFCLELDGKTVTLEEDFDVVGTGKYSVIHAPPAHPHCLCSLAYTLKPTAIADEYFTEPKQPSRPDYFAVQSSQVDADAYFSIEEYQPHQRYKW